MIFFVSQYIVRDLDSPVVAPRNSSVNSPRGRDRIESSSASRMRGQTPIYFIDGCNKRTPFSRRDLSERLVCSYLYAARSYLPRSAVLCGFLFALRAYIYIYVSVLPPRFGLSSCDPLLPFLLLPILRLLSPLLRLPARHNRGGRFYL